MRAAAAALRRLGFEVTTELDADRVALTEALRAFTRQSAGADVSLVFYAGHGIEMDGVNYLLPVDARLERDVDVRYETVTLDDLLVSTSGASLRLVILDACRNNPLARSMQRTFASRSVSDGSFGDLDEDGRAGSQQPVTRPRCWRIWSNRWRSACSSGGCARGCWHRRTVSSVRTSITRWSASTI